MVLVLCVIFLSPISVVRALSLTVGTTEFYPPYIMKSVNQKMYGFDISVMNKLCSLLQIQCKYKQMRFRDLLTAIMNNEVDLAISSLVITPERLKRIHFTVPYAPSNGGYLSAKNNNIVISEPTQLTNLRIGIQNGTVYTKYIRSLNIKNTKVITYSSQYEQIDALNKNQIDIMVTDYQIAVWWSNSLPQQVRLAGKPFNSGNGLGIAVSEKNVGYLNEINAAILRLKKTNIIQKLNNQYFF